MPGWQVPCTQHPLQFAAEQGAHEPWAQRSVRAQWSHGSPFLPQATSLSPLTQKVPSQQPAQVPQVEGGLQNPATQRPEQV